MTGKGGALGGEFCLLFGHVGISRFWVLLTFDISVHKLQHLTSVSALLYFHSHPGCCHQVKLKPHEIRPSEGVLLFKGLLSDFLGILKEYSEFSFLFISAEIWWQNKQVCFPSSLVPNFG